MKSLFYIFGCLIVLSKNYFGKLILYFNSVTKIV